jgi:putative transcriptional regulator
MPTIRKKLEEIRANPRGFTPEERARLEAMSDEEIERNAESDPDNPPLSDEQLDRMVFGRDVRLAREKTGLSQAKFAARFRINPTRLRDWEQGRFQPDSVARAYIRVIARETEAVERALSD